MGRQFKSDRGYRVAKCRMMSHDVGMTTMQNASESLHVTFGDRLRRLRLSQGMDQKQFGDAIGVSGATVGKYELQLHDPRQARLVLNSIRLVYGKDAAAFVVGADPQPTCCRPRHLVLVPQLSEVA